jgi:hypothetical protein
MFGFVVGGGAVVLPFLVNESAHPLGLWLAILEATSVITVILAVGLALAQVPRRGRRGYFGVGLLLAMAALGWLFAVGILLLFFWDVLFPG